jgi:hypothetical protein
LTDNTHREPHLTPEQTAWYLDRVLSPPEQAAIEAHLADCPECREEVVALRRLPSFEARARWLVRTGVAAGLAAAAVALLMVRGGVEPRPGPSTHREPEQGATTSLVPISPVGRVNPPVTLAWSPIRNGALYRVTLFDAEGMVLYRRDVTDSTLPLPDSIKLLAGRSYFWKVESDTGWSRWVGSRLAEFSVARDSIPDR